jgi:S-adenosylmethionine/arginine decarboxylase-like enzyme
VQLIETSNICAHFVEETDDFYLDVFSCKPFRADDVEAVIRQYFQPVSIQSHTFDRQAKSDTTSFLMKH